MKLDRETHPTGKCKYALINLRKIPGDPQTPRELAAAILAHPEAVEWGATGSENEFFLLKLKDRFAEPALRAYAAAAAEEDGEYAASVQALADRAGPNSPWCKSPD